MISSIRKSFKKKEYQVAVLVMIFSFGFLITIGEMIKKRSGGGDWVISIDNYKVSKEQFSRKVEEEKLIIDSFKKQLGKYADTFLGSMGLDPKELAIKALINEALLSKLAKELNLQLSPEFVAQEFAKQGANLQMLSELLHYPSVSDFENEIKNNLKSGIMLDLASGAFYVPEFQAKNQFNETFTKKKFSVLVLPYEKYLEMAKKIPLTESELEKFYKEISEKDKTYWIPEKREGIKYDFFQTGYNLNVQEKEIEEYYNKNKNLFIEKPAQVQVRRILFKNDKNLAEKIRNELLGDPKKFAEYAKQYSQDTETVNEGGLVDPFIRGQKDQAFEETAFALPKDGDISDVIQTSDGFELLQRVSKRPVIFKKLDTLKGQIKEILQKEKFGNVFKLDVKKFTDSSNIDEKAFEEFLKKKGATQKKIEASLNDASKLAKKLFEINVEGKIKLMYDDNSASLIKLTKINKAHLPELKSVKDKISNIIYQQRAQKKLKEDLDKLKRDSSQKTFEQLKDLFELKLINTPWINSESKEIESIKNLPITQMLKLQKEDSIVDNLNGQNGYLIKLIAVEPFDTASFDRKRDLMKEDLYKQNKSEFDSGFVASLQKNAKININNKFIKKQLKF